MVNWIIIISLSLVAGIADSKGFYFASKVWTGGTVDFQSLLKSVAGFEVGIIFYITAIFFMNKIHLNAVELQVGLWFAAAIIGVAVATGNFLHWQLLDRILAILTMVGFMFLVVRNS